MTDALLGLALGGLAGAALGTAFYAGLWATVRRVAAHGSAGWLLAASLALRLALAGAVLTLLAREGVPHLLGGLLGFMAARPLATRAFAGPPRPRAEAAPARSTAPEAAPARSTAPAAARARGTREDGRP